MPIAICALADVEWGVLSPLSHGLATLDLTQGGASIDTTFWQTFVGEFLEVGSEEGVANPFQNPTQNNPIPFRKPNAIPYPKPS